MNEITQAPKLRFQGFTDDWNEYKLDELGKFKNGINKDKNDFGFGHAFVNLLDVFGKSTLNKSIEFSLVNANEKELKIYNLKKGDVLFIRSSVKREGVGETILVEEDLPNTVYSGFLIRYRTDKNFLSNGFKKYCFWFKKFRNSLISYSSTSANTNINQESLSLLKINLPNLKEQQKIAAFLSIVDKKIKLLQQKKALLEQYKKGSMQQLFSQKLRFKDEDGNEYPDWEERSFGDFVTNKTESYNPKKESGNPMCIELEHLESDKGILSGYVEGNKQKSIKNKFEEGEVLFGKLRPYLRKYWLTQFNGVCTTEIWVLKSIENRALNSFIFYIVQTTGFSKLTEISSGSKMPRANWSVVSSGLFCLPCLKEQAKIVNFLSAIDNKIQLVANQLEKTRKFKKGLLQQLFV